MSSDDAPGVGPAPGPDEFGMRKLTDARAMRALAHPVRVALLEALAHAGTLTATQAGEILGESPANCAFHLRTLAKYGYVEEAGGGRGRERPWRRVHAALQITSDQDDPLAAAAADEIGDFWLDMVLSQARAALSRRSRWPAEWQHNALTDHSTYIVYATPGEADELGAEIRRLHQRFIDRVDHPERRPPGAMPIELLTIGFPMLHLAALPVTGPQPE